jgi:hypothetical protein
MSGVGVRRPAQRLTIVRSNIMADKLNVVHPNASMVSDCRQVEIATRPAQSPPVRVTDIRPEVIP